MRNVIRLIIYAIVAGLVIVNLHAIIRQKINGDPIVNVLGYGPAVVLSGSMEPTLSVDDLVIIRHTKNVKPGDIAMYRGEHMLVIHRVIGIDETTGDYIFQGDANNTPDDPVSADRVIGLHVLTIPGVGALLYSSITPYLIIGLFMIALIVL